MEFKPFKIHVGYNEAVTSYQNNRRGKGPNAEVVEWLHENVGQDRWQYIWLWPNTSQNRWTADIIGDHGNLTDDDREVGGMFYFDTEEDKLLFIMKWLSTYEKPYITWHPV